MFQGKLVFNYLYRFVKPYKLAFFSLFFLALGRSLFSSTFAGYIYKNLIDTLNLSISLGERYEIAIALLIPMILSFVLSMSLGRYSEWVMYRLMAHSIVDMYRFAFSKLLAHSSHFYANSFTGGIVAKTKRFVRAFDVILGIMLFNFWSTLVIITASVIALFFQSKILAFYFFLWCILYASMVVIFVKQKIKIDMKKAEADSKVTSVLADSITNIGNIKSFSASEREKNYFNEVVLFFKSIVYKAWQFTIGRHAFQSFTMTIFHIFILYTMINLWRSGEITVGVFVMVYVYFTTIMDRIWDLSSGLTNFMEALTDAQEMVNIFEAEVDIKDPVNPQLPKINKGMIDFKNVTFSYKDGADVLDNFNLTIKHGEKVGLVGYSGSGKSTITKLILRFMDPQEGEILIDGQNISSITQNDLRHFISYVPQESILFHRTIRENIGYSKNNASTEEIIEAAQKAYAHDFVLNLSQGYETLVGERGIKLSGGERQRVAIARAMLKKAPVLVLDEATSSLDSISEFYIQKAFDELMKDKTTIVIAHRLSTIQKMDRIIVLDKGKIIEEGKHQDLIEKQGFYASLWDHQTGNFIEE